MENYIVINGKKIELTEEQLKQLGIEVKKKRNNPFNNEINKYEDMPYYMIDHTDIENGVATEFSTGYSNCNDFEKTAVDRANSFNDRDFAQQLYLHELLNRKLLKYAWDNEAEDCEWTIANNNKHYYIGGCGCGQYIVRKTWSTGSKDFGIVYFSKGEVAEQAIKDVIEPFIKTHKEFVW